MKCRGPLKYYLRTPRGPWTTFWELLFYSMYFIYSFWCTIWKKVFVKTSCWQVLVFFLYSSYWFDQSFIFSEKFDTFCFNWGLWLTHDCHGGDYLDYQNNRLSPVCGVFCDTFKTVSQTFVNCLFRGNTTKWNVRSAPWSGEHPGSHAKGVPLHLYSQVLPSNWHSRSWLQHQLLPVVGSHHSLYSVSFVQDFHLNHVRTSKHNSVMVQ